MASKVILKFDKYWKDVNELLAIVAMMDPRYKMKLVEYYFPIIYGDISSSNIKRVQEFYQDLLKDYS